MKMIDAMAEVLQRVREHHPADIADLVEHVAKEYKVDPELLVGELLHWLVWHIE